MLDYENMIFTYNIFAYLMIVKFEKFDITLLLNLKLEKLLYVSSAKSSILVKRVIHEFKLPGKFNLNKEYSLYLENKAVINDLFLSYKVFFIANLWTFQYNGYLIYVSSLKCLVITCQRSHIF